MAEMLAAESGILVEPGQPVCLAEAIASLLLDPTHRHAMGRRARQRVLNEYNAQLIGDLMESAYRDAIASTTPTR
jgi:glycosyltransferase involved in cell wall biosynthesis